MDCNPLVSICIPTNGVIEWIFPVLDSIYKQKIDKELFEVVITDNGNNKEFKRRINQYLSLYDNIVYEETSASAFVNEIEAYKRAKGQLIKYNNHRNVLFEGSLKRFIDFASKYSDERPIVYFSNGVLDISQDEHIYNTFDGFVKGLSYWSSWSTGMTIWKEDYDRLSKDISLFNEMFPHTDILFGFRDRNKYIIDNRPWACELPENGIPKGKYDLFDTFGNKYTEIIKQLYIDGSISGETYKYVLDKNLEFIVFLYWEYCIRKRTCSYDLTGLDSIFTKYYSKGMFRKELIKIFFKRVKYKLFGTNYAGMFF